MNIGDVIKINVETRYGLIAVTFTVISVMPNNTYALMAQNRIAVGQPSSDDSSIWHLSDTVDLIHMLIDYSVAHDVL